MWQFTPQFSWRHFSDVAGDTVIILAAFVVALLIRFEFVPSPYKIDVLLRTAPIALTCLLIGLRRACVYRGLYYPILAFFGAGLAASRAFVAWVLLRSLRRQGGF